MKTNSTLAVMCTLVTLVPVSYCIYMHAEIKNALAEYKSLHGKACVLEDKASYEENMNYNDGFSDGYESAKNEQRLVDWQSSILTKGYESGFIKCYYVTSDGRQIEFPLNKWIGAEFQLNKWMPQK